MNIALLDNFYPKFYKNIIPLKQLGVSSRVFNNWRDTELIDYHHLFTLSDRRNNVTRKNIKLNIYDAMWVLIIKELRSINIDLKTIKQVKDHLYSKIDINYLLDSITQEDLDEYLISIDYENIPRRGIISFDYLTNISEYKKFLLAQYKIDSRQFMLLAFSIGQILIYGHTPFLTLIKKPLSETYVIDVFNPSLEIQTPSNNNYAIDFLKGLGQNSMISIPLRPLFNTFLEDENLLKYSQDFGLLTDEEIKLLNIIKEGDFTKIIIHKSQNNTLTIEKNSKLELRGSKVTEIRKTLGLKDYDRVEVIQRNKDHLVINNLKKHKIDLGKP